MAARKSGENSRKVEPIEKVANLLALLLVKDAKQGESIMTLLRVGFSDDEISLLLKTTPAVIRQTRYLSKK